MYFILNNIHYCDGGYLLNGCGRYLFPWSRKFKIKNKDTYCCYTCFKKEMEIFSKTLE